MRLGKIGWAGLLLALCLHQPAPVRAETADVYLRNGLKLRGEITRDGADIIVRNAAGEVRLSPDLVLRVDPIEPLPTQSAPATRAAQSQSASQSVPPPVQAAPTTSPVTRPAEVPAAPELAERDIQRLKLSELKLDGPAEMVRPRFMRKGKQRDLWLEVFEQLKRSGNYRSEWENTLLRGRPHEKLQLIVRQTGLEHLERIEIENDPEVFDTFKRRVLPHVVRSCARSGCHGGRTARIFRFPSGSAATDEYAYTYFVLLDQLETEHGPLLDRANPEKSVLLDYLLPQEDNPRAHPDVGKGPAYRAVLRDQDDRNYAVILDWINSLAVPRPDYQLEYKNPYAGRLPPLAPDARALPADAETQPENAAEAESDAGDSPPTDLPPATRPAPG